MRKTGLIILILLSWFGAKAQSPVIISQPYIFNRYVHVKGSLFSDSTLLSSDSSNRVGTTAWIKRLVAGGGATGPAGGDLTGNYPNPTVNTINSITSSFYDPTSSIQTQLNGLQPLLGFTPENIANKATDFTTLNNSLYPTTQAVANYITSGGGVTASNGLTKTVNNIALGGTLGTGGASIITGTNAFIVEQASSTGGRIGLLSGNNPFMTSANNASSLFAQVFANEDSNNRPYAALQAFTGTFNPIQIITTKNAAYGNVGFAIKDGVDTVGGIYQGDYSTKGKRYNGWLASWLAVKNGIDSLHTLISSSAFTLTTTGTSGAATYTGGTLNIPQYQAALGFTPENVANKETTLTNSATAYPSGSAVTAALAGLSPALTFTSPLVNTSNTITVNQATNSQVNLGLFLYYWGDSLTAGQGAFDATYPNDFNVLSGFWGSNQGVAGNTSAQLLTRMTAATTTYGYPSIIWIGINDVHTGVSTGTTEANIASCVGLLTSTHYVVVGITPSNGDSTGTAYATKINTINANTSSTQGIHYFNALAYLQTKGNGGTADNHAISVGLIPPSLMSDSTHLTAAGYLDLAQGIYASCLSILSTTSTNVLTVANAPLFSPYGLNQYSLNTGGQYQIGGYNVVWLPSGGATSRNFFLGGAGPPTSAPPTGTGNLGISPGSLAALTSGGNNVAGGPLSLFVITTQFNNTAWGFGAGENAASSNGTYLGYLSGNLVTSATQTITIGASRNNVNTNGAVDIGGVYIATAATTTGSSYGGRASISMLPTNAWFSVPASTTAGASFNLGDAGTTPTSPNNADLWIASNHLYGRLGGTTYQLDQQPGTGVTAIGVTTANGVSGSSSGGTTPNLTIALGAITPTTVNGNTFTTGTYTLTGTAGKTLTFNNSITLAGTDAQTYTFPSTSSSVYTTATGSITPTQLSTSMSASTGGVGPLVFGTQPAITAPYIKAIVTAVNSTATLTASQLAGGTISSTSAALTTLTLPTAASIITHYGAAQGGYFPFIVDNVAGANIVTVAVNTGITANSVSTTLTVPAGQAAQFGLYIASGSTIVIARIW